MNRLAPRVVLAFLVLAVALAAYAVPFDTVKAASGRVTFQRYCASCHGAGAKGDGRLASIIKVPVADLTTLAERNQGEFPSDRVRQFIDGRKDVVAHGLREMPVWGDALQHPDQPGDQEKIAQDKIDQLVEYLKSLQTK